VPSYDLVLVFTYWALQRGHHASTRSSSVAGRPAILHGRAVTGRSGWVGTRTAWQSEQIHPDPSLGMMPRSRVGRHTSSHSSWASRTWSTRVRHVSSPHAAQRKCSMVARPPVSPSPSSCDTKHASTPWQYGHPRSRGSGGEEGTSLTIRRIVPSFLLRVNAMIFRQLFDATSCTYTYLLADEHSREAVLVDPVFEQHTRDAALVHELGLELRATIDTHCHADHVTGAWLMKTALGSRIGLSGAYGARNVDLPLADGDVVPFGGERLEVRATPGHTAGCLSLVTGDQRRVFTGDALLVRGAGRTDFQQGDARRLFRSIRESLLTLPDECAVYPGHDYEGRTSSTIGEERVHNPRIGGEAREEDFVGFMENLALPHPKQLAVALPANMRAGEPEDGRPPTRPDWGPVVTTYAGLWEIGSEWVAAHRGEVRVLDVRSPAECCGELPALDGALLIPLEALRGRVAEVPADQPVVVVCQTGRRSGLGASILKKAGVERVASLAGGMVRWRELALPGLPG
jgi:sulfur dioxygenase